MMKCIRFRSSQVYPLFVLASIATLFMAACGEKKAAPATIAVKQSFRSQPASERVREMDSSLLNDSAFSRYRKQLEAARKLNDAAKVFEELNRISEFLYYKAAYDSSLAYLDQALALSMAVDSPGWKSTVELHMGNNWLSKLDHVQAMTHYLNASKWAEHGSPALSGSIAQKLGSLNIRLKRYPEALVNLNAAEENALRNKNDVLLALTYTSKGIVYASDAYPDKEKSNEYLNKAYEMAKRLNWRFIQQNALVALAKNKVSAAQYVTALKHLDIAEAAYDGSEGAIVQIKTMRARCYLETGKLNAAEENIKGALALAENKRKYFLPQIMNLYSALEEKRGNYKKALDYYRQSKLYNDTVDGGDIRDSIAGLNFSYQMLNKDKELITHRYFIQKQKEEIYRKNYLTYTLVAVCVFITLAFFLLIRYRQRIQKQRNELMAWKAKVEGEELERARIAGILHDSVGATISTACIWLKNAMASNKELHLNEEYQEGMKLLDIGLESIRNGAHNLMPDLLQRLGLPEAIGVYCNNVERATGMKIGYEHFGTFDGLSNELSLLVYRSVQELIQNVVKHAQATSALVSLSCHNSILAITVEDDGAGFIPELIATGKGIGLQNIANNAKFNQGHFNVQSEPGAGTSVYVEFKVQEQAKKK